jgi:hypothetical protein
MGGIVKMPRIDERKIVIDRSIETHFHTGCISTAVDWIHAIKFSDALWEKKKPAGQFYFNEKSDEDEFGDNNPGYLLQPSLIPAHEPWVSSVSKKPDSLLPIETIKIYFRRIYELFIEM